MNRKNVNIRNILLAAVCLCTSLATTAQDTVRLTLDSCLAYAYGHNPTVLGARLQREAAAAALEQARWNFTPTLSASAGSDMSFFQGTKTTNTSYGAGASWTLFDGMNNVYTLRSSKVEQQRSDLGVEKSRNDVAVQIVTAYLEVLANQERQQYLAELNASARKQANDAEARYNAGRLLESDFLLLQANWKRSESEMLNAGYVIANGLQRLRTLIGLADSVALNVEPMEQWQPSDTNWAICVDSLPELQMSRLELEKAQYQLKIAKGAHMPQLGFNAYASINRNIRVAAVIADQNALYTETPFAITTENQAYEMSFPCSGGTIWNGRIAFQVGYDGPHTLDNNTVVLSNIRISSSAA